MTEAIWPTIKTQIKILNWTQVFWTRIRFNIDKTKFPGSNKKAP